MNRAGRGDAKVLSGVFYGLLGLAGSGVIFYLGVVFLGLNLRPHGNKKPVGLVLASSLASATENFYGEYNELPDVGSSEFDTTSSEGVELLELLLAREGVGPDVQNTRDVIFLQVKEAKGNRGGIAYGKGGAVEGQYDPFGNPYRVVLNSEYEDSLVFDVAGQPVRLRGRQVAVWSVGADRIEGTKDDSRTWR